MSKLRTILYFLPTSIMKVQRVNLDLLYVKLFSVVHFMRLTATSLEIIPPFGERAGRAVHTISSMSVHRIFREKYCLKLAGPTSGSLS